MAESEASHPITVAIERRIDPTRTMEATSWMQSGTDLATGFDGFLGSGWVRAGESSDLWYMLYRFRDIPTLEAWEGSAQREWWLSSGRPFAKEVRVERRTGIEGWFDAPFATDIESLVGADAGPTTGPIQQPIPSAPPRWKQAVAIWLGFFPTNLLASWLLGFVPGLAEWPLWMRILLTTLLLTPIMTYAVLPAVTRMLRPWLHRGRFEHIWIPCTAADVPPSTLGISVRAVRLGSLVHHRRRHPRRVRNLGVEGWSTGSVSATPW